MHTEERVNKLEARVRKLESADEMITVTKMEYDQLLKDQEFLQALVAAGVDNWQGYDIAQDIRDGKEW